jgi:hypothetical protein
MTIIKPQDWHNVRQLTFIPNHFIKFKLPDNIDRLGLLSWIEENTTGRYAVEVAPIEDIATISWSLSNDKEQYIAFEESSDVTKFSLFYK